MLYESEKDKSPFLSQINCSTNMNKLIFAGCEDSMVRVFDMNSGKIVKKLRADASVSCISGRLGWQVVNGDQSGGLAVWDIRMFDKIFEDRKACWVKYEEGVQDIVTH